jgi:hypothetical protein
MSMSVPHHEEESRAKPMDPGNTDTGPVKLSGCPVKVWSKSHAVFIFTALSTYVPHALRSCLVW